MIRASKEVVLTVLVMVVMFTVMAYNNTMYNRYGVVTSIENEVVEVTDKSGNVWAFETTDNFELKENVKLRMSNNATDNNVYDDVILSVKKCK